MRLCDIHQIMGWTSRVLTPIKHPMKPIDLSSGRAIVVAFDREDIGKRKITIQRKGRMAITTHLRKTLCFTFAAIIDGELMTDCWDIERRVTLDQLLDHIRSWLKLKRSTHIYLVTHYAPAELRGISDWTRAVEHDNIHIYGDDRIHFVRDDVTLIDSLAFFQKKLKVVAKFVGMEKIELGKRPDGEDWIAHMDEFKRDHPQEFWKYALNDSVILIKAFLKYRQFFLDRFQIEILRVTTVPTAPAIAMRILRRMMKCNAMKSINELTHKERKRAGGVYGWSPEGEPILAPSEIKLRMMALLCYWGGRRETFKPGLFEGAVIALDYSGHYNRCGIDQPCSNEFTDWFETKDLGVILKCEGFVEIRNWRFPGSERYPGLAQKYAMGKRLISVLSGDIAYTTCFELHYLIERFDLRFKSISAVVFHPTENEINHPLREFLLMFRKMKDDAAERCKQEGRDKDDDLEYYLAKLIGNAVIGKFMQAVEDDEETRLEFLEQIHVPRKHGKKRMKDSAKFLSPEWAALILGRARILLGIAFSMIDVITGHTDSVIGVDDPEKVEKVIVTMRELGGELEVKYRCDGFWSLRSSVYIALEKKDGKWQVKMIDSKEGPVPQVAHHGLPTNKKKDFYDPIIRTLNGAPWVAPILEKRHLAKVSTEVSKGVPLGCEYTTQAIPKLNWDFKRKLPGDFDITRDTFMRSVDTEPYVSSYECYEDERLKIHAERKISRGHPSRSEILERAKVRAIELRSRGRSFSAIACEVGQPKTTIQRWIRKSGPGNG